jgi:hypothetical protein
MEKMRPEFKAGLDALTKYIFERTKPKQLGSIVMTGPMFAGLTQSFLDAINAGAVPTIATSWQVSPCALKKHPSFYPSSIYLHCTTKCYTHRALETYLFDLWSFFQG